MEFQFLGNTYNVAEFRALVVSKEPCQEALEKYDNCETADDYEELCLNYFSWLNFYILKKYDLVHDFLCRLAEVKKNGKWGLIDATGKEVVPCIYEATYYFLAGSVRVQKNGKWKTIYIDSEEVA
mgnify:CR=1 FL=1